MIFHQPLNSLSNYNYNIALYTDTIWNFHFHKNFELIYVLSGKVSCTVNNQNTILEKGDFGLCLPCDIHKYVPEKDSEYWVLVFSEDFVRFFSNQIRDKRATRFGFRCDKEVEMYVRHRIIKDKAPSILTLKSCLYALCEQYINCIKLEKKNNESMDFMSYIIDYISKNFSKNISLKTVAKLLGYNYNYMSRCFHNVFSMNFSDFVNVYRFEAAVDLLENTEKNIIDITYESGFQSVRTFNNYFKKTTGMTPSEYRNAYHN